MSTNVLRAMVKKNLKRDKKKDKQAKMTASKETSKRKILSVSASPDVPPVNNQLPRKPSLGTDSPSHVATIRTPTSPLVIKSTSSASLSTPRRDSNPALIGSNSTASTPTPILPKVSVSCDDQPLDRQGIIDITVDVQSFLAAISKLKKAMEQADPHDSEVPHSPGADRQHSPPEVSDTILTNLSELIQVVQTCLDQHSGMQSTEIKDAVKNLTVTYQNCNHISAATCTMCSRAVEVLIDAFTNSVSMYLTGECVQQDLPPQLGKGLGKSGMSSAMLKGFSKSHDNLTRYNSAIDLSQAQTQLNEPIVDQIDQALMNIDASVDVATRYIKLRVKYLKEITSYLYKRAQIEAKRQQQMARLVKSTHIVLEELAQEECLPLLEVFRNSVEQDIKSAANCNATYSMQVGNKLIEPLEHTISECEKLKKDLTHTWQREQKKLAEARTTMKNAKSKYRFLGQDLSRVKNLLAADPYGKQAEKRKKEVTDLESRWQEAESAYKNTVAVCNECQYQVHESAQKSILCAYRRMVIESDKQLRAGLEAYFTLQSNFFTTLPDPMAQNLEDVAEYKVGVHFMRYIEQHPVKIEEPEDYLFEEFDPEAAEMEPDQPDNLQIPNSTSTDSTFYPDDTLPKRSHSPQPIPAWEASSTVVNDANRRASATSSPRTNKKKQQRPRSIAYLLEPNAVFDLQKNGVASQHLQGQQQRRSSDHTQQHGGKDSVGSPPHLMAYHDDRLMSKPATTHFFKKLRGPSRCRQCDTYVYFHGHECEVCGLACHKKCLETLAIRCGNKRLARKMNTFGVDFQKHLKATKRYIPIIVTKCITEIDERGLDTQGLYRISSAKTKLEHLCQLFESGADRVVLSDKPCHLIGSCLKLYFRQLPEPLLTFGLYQEFITFARECSYTLPCKMDIVKGEKAERAREMLDRLKGLLQKLPYENYITLARLLYHLHRVGSPAHVKHNCMPPSNLGIVFGPNLLRQREMVASLALLADMTAQAKAIEIMISHVHDVIHVSEDQIFAEVEQEYDDGHTTEMLVDDVAEPIKSPQLDVDDATTAGSRTPYNTPPETRRGYISELGEVLEALQSVGTSRRNSQPSLSANFMKPSIGEIRDTTFSTSSPGLFTSLPGSIGVQEDTLSALSRYLRPGVSTGSNPLEKMLTPVEERAAEIEGGNSLSDDDDNIITSTSVKLDGILYPRSGSQLSNQGGLHWNVGSEGDSEVGSTRDTVSILSSGYGTPPRHILNSSNSMELLDQNSISEQFREEITQILGDQDHIHQKDSSQGSDDSSTFSEGVQALLSHSPATSPRVSLAFSSTEGTPVRTMSESRMFTRQSNSLGHAAHRRKRPPFDRSSASAALSSPYSSSTHSSISRTSQGSYSEAFGEDYRGREERQSKKSAYDKWERYERSRSMEVSGDRDLSSNNNNKTPQVDITIQYAQESNNLTSTDAPCSDKNAQETENESSQQMPDNEKGSQDTYDDVSVEEERTEQHKSKNKGSVASILLQEIHRHADSGIDDTGSPDAKGARSMVKSLSAGDAEESHLSETLSPRTYAVVFTSRESGLAESPDPDGINDDEQSSVVEYHVHLREEYEDDDDDEDEDVEETDREGDEEVKEEPLKKLSQLIPSTGEGNHFGDDGLLEESYSPKEGTPLSLLEKNPSVFSMNSDHTLNVGPEIVEFEDTDDVDMESGAYSSSDRAPRSLEGPSFSRYARVPIHNADHKSRHQKLSDSPVFDTRPDWRLRTSSLDDLSETSSASPLKIGDRDRRALSETRSFSTAVSISASPQHHSQSYQRAGGLKSSQSTGTFTEMQDKLIQNDPLFKNSSGGSLKMEKKTKKGIGSALAKKFTAFRKFKVTPSTSESSTPSLVLSDDDSRSSPSHNGASIQASPQAQSPLHYGDFYPKRRVRMRSPDLYSPTKHTVNSLRRSQSSEDLLESKRHRYYDEEVNEKPNKSRGGIFNKVGSWRNKRKGYGGRESPVILVDFTQHTYDQSSILEGVSHLEPSSSTLSDSNSKNSSKKRSRHPQFV